MFSEMDAYEALGLELKNDEEAAPGQDEPGQAAPPGEGEPDSPAGDQGAPPEDTPTQGEAETPEVEAAPDQDAVRRAVEQAVAAERARQQEQMRDFFRKAQLTNTITGEAIGSMEEFEAWDRDFQDQRLRQELSEGRLTPESLERAIAQNPAVKQAEELSRQAREQRQAEEQAAFQVRLQEEIAEIGKLDPSVHSLEDVVHGPNGQKFCQYVRNNGLPFLDAFRLANMDALQKRYAEQAAGHAAQAARTQERELARSKDHLTGAGAVQGTGSAAVPPEARALFREFLPEASESEIQSYYDKYERSVGK